MKGTLWPGPVERPLGAVPAPASSATGASLRLVDLACLAYAAATGLAVLALRARVADWPSRLLVHGVLIAGALALVRRRQRSPGRVWRLARLYYPAVFFGYGYLEQARLQPLVTGGYWASDYLVAADKFLFGFHPTVAVQDVYGGPLDEVLAAFYLSYLVVPFVVTSFWLARGRLDWALEAADCIATVYVCNYLLFLLLPALGPRSVPGLSELHHRLYTGRLFARCVLAIEGRAGSIPGGVFPSAHVSIIVTWALLAWRRGRKMGTAAWLAAAGVMPASVYLGYHHAVDVLAGFVLAIAIWTVVGRSRPGRGARWPARSS